MRNTLMEASLKRGVGTSTAGRSWARQAAERAEASRSLVQAADTYGVAQQGLNNSLLQPAPEFKCSQSLGTR